MGIDRNKKTTNFIQSQFNKEEFLDHSFVENYLGSNITIDRVDPFDVEHMSLSLQQIQEMEETGRIETFAESEDTNDLVSIVRKALVRLPKLEREILVESFSKGRTVKQLSKQFKLNPTQLVNIKTKAVKQFKELFLEQKRIAGITADYNVCPICSSGNRKEIEELLHVWLDNHNWKFRGILSYLKEEFEISTCLVKVQEHLTYHMLMPSDVSNFPFRTDNNKSGKTVSITLSLPIEIKESIDSVIEPYDINYRTALVWAIKFGILDLQEMLNKNEKKRALQRDALYFFSKISI